MRSRPESCPDPVNRRPGPSRRSNGNRLCRRISPKPTEECDGLIASFFAEELPHLPGRWRLGTFLLIQFRASDTGRHILNMRRRASERRVAVLSRQEFLGRCIPFQFGIQEAEDVNAQGLVRRPDLREVGQGFSVIGGWRTPARAGGTWKAEPMPQLPAYDALRYEIVVVEVLDGEIVAPGKRQGIGQLKECVGVGHHQHRPRHVLAVLDDRCGQLLPAQVRYAVIVLRSVQADHGIGQAICLARYINVAWAPPLWPMTPT